MIMIVVSLSTAATSENIDTKTNCSKGPDTITERYRNTPLRAVVKLEHSYFRLEVFMLNGYEISKSSLKVVSIIK